MKVFKNLSITAAALLLTLPVISGHHEEGAKDPMKKNVMTAKKWVEAGYTSKDKAINTSGKVAKAKKKTDLLTPFFIKTFFICSFRGFETNKITANRLPICMAMSRLKSFLRPITNLL